jgi:preprotein translocase subunit SecF
VLARRASVARQGAAAAAAGPVASARRGSARRSSTALADRETALPGQVDADVVVESPASVRPDAPRGTTTPRPGQKPQRPGNRRSGSGKRR